MREEEKLGKMPRASRGVDTNEQKASKYKESVADRRCAQHSAQEKNMSLKVAVGVVKRGVKELAMYREEVSQGESKLAAMDQSDNYYNQTINTLEESKTMVKQTASNLERALQDLESKMDPSSPLHQEATQLLISARAALS